MRRIRFEHRFIEEEFLNICHYRNASKALTWGSRKRSCPALVTFRRNLLRVWRNVCSYVNEVLTGLTGICLLTNKKNNLKKRVNRIVKTAGEEWFAGCVERNIKFSLWQLEFPSSLVAPVLIMYLSLYLWYSVSASYWKQTYCYKNIKDWKKGYLRRCRFKKKITAQECKRHIVRITSYERCNSYILWTDQPRGLVVRVCDY